MRKFILPVLVAALCAIAFLTTPASAQVPQLINYQGRVAVGGVNFDGTGQFKFALVNAVGTTTYWSNNGTSAAGSEPTAAVSLPVAKGLYSVLLGDATLPNMTVVPASVFTNADVRLRVWFNDGTNG
ncbi:MAG: galactose oxidase, partial [Chthoniobacteraceae bacterium]